MDLAAPGSIESFHYNLPDVLPAHVFRTYDIRGPVAEDGLTADLAYAIGLAIGCEARAVQQNTIIVGRDGRLSGPKLTDAVIAGLRTAGLNVIYIGTVPTPLLYFATNRLATRSGVMVTASHNPANHNGFKIVLNGSTLAAQGISAIEQRIRTRNLATAIQGNFSKVDIVDDYSDYVVTQIQLARPLKVVVDCGNGIAGSLVPQLYRRLGCEVVELYCELDGRFPNHHPDPTVPENLRAIIAQVKATHADIGLAFDGDADRLGIVTNKGEIIWPDRQMMLFAIDLLARLPAADIIFDVKCSRNLPKIISEHGGNPIMWRTGHSVLKAKLFELNAPLAGEMSGHIFFRDQWFGFDDGIYVGARLLRILSLDARTVSDVFADLPDSVNTPELKLPMLEEDKQPFMQRLMREADFGEAELITIDGVRAEFAHGWGLVRPSNTSPYLILRFEADSEKDLNDIKQLFRIQLLQLDAHLQLPF